MGSTSSKPEKRYPPAQRAYSSTASRPAPRPLSQRPAPRPLSQRPAPRPASHTPTPSRPRSAAASSSYDTQLPPPPYSVAAAQQSLPPVSSQSQTAPRPSAPPMPQYTGSDPLAFKINTIIQHNRLWSFYPPARFHAVMQRLAAVDFDQVAIKWRLPKDTVYDLAPLALYDIVFYCDDSGSMAFEDDGDRIDDLKSILAKVADIAALFDDDGITVRFMNNSTTMGDAVRSSAEAIALVDSIRFGGATPLGTNLHERVIRPMVLDPAKAGRLAKPVLVICITDGEPSEKRDTFASVVRAAKFQLNNTSYGSGALAVQIAQVGRDKRAQRFLESLDQDPYVGGMIDCTSYYEMEEEEYARRGLTLTPDQWVLKMCVGAIDPAYDAKDE